MPAFHFLMITTQILLFISSIYLFIACSHALTMTNYDVLLRPAIDYCAAAAMRQPLMRC